MHLVPIFDSKSQIGTCIFRNLKLLRWISVTETCQLQVEWCGNLYLFKPPALENVESLILLSSSPFFCDESSQLCVLWVLFKFRSWRKAEEQRQFLQCTVVIEEKCCGYVKNEEKVGGNVKIEAMEICINSQKPVRKKAMGNQPQ